MKIFRSKTIRSELRWYLLGLIVLLVVFYTYLLQDYFIRGIDIATKIEFNIIATEFIEDRKINPDASLPKRPYLTTFTNWLDSPLIFQTLFPEGKHHNNELLTVDKYDTNSYEPTQYVFMRYLISNNEYLYMVEKYPPDILSQQHANEYINTLIVTLPLALLFIVSAVLLIYHLGRKIGLATNALNTWAENLTLDSLDERRPNFHYAELNSVAEQLQQAFYRIGSLLEKEHLFLRFTSHELRTPLAITSANVELLEKLNNSELLTTQILRIKRANSSMQHITEALLWLSRESEAIPELESIISSNIIEDIINDHQYLLENNNINIQVSKNNIQLTVPIILFKIIISNLIRNALQYTVNGTVTINIADNEITLCNQNSDVKEYTIHEDEHGFGLGLVLVERLSKKLGWQFNYQIIPGGRRTCLVIN